jgi:hypothetical protein
MEVHRKCLIIRPPQTKILRTSLITLAGRYPSVYDPAREFYNDKKISRFRIHAHHEVLRAKEKKVAFFVEPSFILLKYVIYCLI